MHKKIRADGAMYRVFEATRLEGLEEGHAKGIIEMGIAYGVTEQDILGKLQENLNISLSKAQDYFEKFSKL